MENTPQEQPLLVTTKRRGVFFGYGIFRLEPSITLRRARMCVHWSVATRGLNGLAATGPADGSRVSAAVPAMILDEVESIALVTPAAVIEWEKGKWTK